MMSSLGKQQQTSQFRLEASAVGGFQQTFMVVSRKNPAPAVASRTNSAQAIPRKQKHAASPLTGEPDVPKPSRQQQQRVASSTPKSKQRRASKPPRTSGWADRLFLLSIFSFIVYAATVCTPYSQREAPYEERPLTCRALITYRTAVLEPYVVPGVKVVYEHTLGHPSVQEHIQPHIAQIKSHTKPVLDVVEQVHENAVKPTVEVLYGQLWKGYVLPWYRTAFLPRYHMYVAPRLQAGWEHGVKKPLEPYVEIGKAYAWDVQLYIHTHGIHKVKAYLQPVYEQLLSAYEKARPTVVKAYTHAQPTLSSAYTLAKQGAETAWVHGRPYLCQAYKSLKLYLGIALKEGGKARRTYVDPHVHKILERVRVSGVDVAGSTVRVHASATSGTPEEPQIVVEEDDVVPTSTTLPEPTPAEETTVVDVPVTPAAEAEQAVPVEDAQEESSVAPPPPTPTPSPDVSEDELTEEILRSAVSVAEQSADAAPTPDLDAAIAEPSGPAHNLEEDVGEKIANVFVRRIEKLTKMEEERIANLIKEAAESATAATTTTTTTTAAASTTAEPSAAAAPEEDLDDFLSDLGIELDGHAPTPAEHAAEAAQKLQDAVNEEPAQVQLTEEEQAEAKKQDTAAKRANILRRHDEWQKKVDTLVEEQKTSVVDNVDAVRIWALSELGDEYFDKNAPPKEKEGTRYRKTERAEGEQGLGKRALGGVERQGERLLKGLETYLSKAKGRSSAWKEGGDKEERKGKVGGEKEKWDEVLGKVEDRFDGVVKAVQGEVHEWFKGMRGREHDLAMEAASAIKALAETAQADLAMDYAWLDDVTYRDWQNYHDLMRKYEKFELEAAHAVYSDANPGAAPPTDAAPPDTSSWPAFATPDPLVLALDKLSAELDDVIAGFKYAVSSMKGQARDVYSIYNLDDPNAESEGFFAVKHEKGEFVDDMRGMPGYDDVGKKQENVEMIGEGVDAAARILVGKDKVVVEENVRKAEGEL